MQFSNALLARCALLFSVAVLPAISMPLDSRGATFDSVPFDPREATIDTVHTALFSGITTCRFVVSSFLARIEAFNPKVNAIMTLNPQALEQADWMDMQLAAGNTTGPLFCIPILLKDNYNTADMNTTAGCLALAGSQPKYDAPAVTALKKAGAIVLGKTNLHELALEGLSVSSLGGQVINPYDFTRTPGGSSGGTGVAVASSFSVFGTGSDTVNSLRSPAASNSLFTIRPTRGLISRNGIVPISYVQDAIGPIARTVSDLAKALTVMASIGYDPVDNTTALIPPSSMGVDYSASLSGSSLKGLRFGLLTGLFNRTASSETTPVNDVIDAMVCELTAAGATVVPITDAIYNSATISANLDVQKDEYREAMDAYLSSPSLGGKHPETLSQLYLNSSGAFLVVPSEYSFVQTSLVSSTSNSSYADRLRGIANLTIAVRTTFLTHQLDALIYPEQQNLVVKIGSPGQSGRNGILGALTGSPVAIVPAGYSPPTVDAPIGVPVGMEILGLPWSEGKLLGIAAEIEKLKRVRKMPVFANMSVEVSEMTAVPMVMPNKGNIPAAYPVGVL